MNADDLQMILLGMIFVYLVIRDIKTGFSAGDFIAGIVIVLVGALCLVVVLHALALGINSFLPIPIWSFYSVS